MVAAVLCPSEKAILIHSTIRTRSFEIDVYHPARVFMKWDSSAPFRSVFSNDGFPATRLFTHSGFILVRLQRLFLEVDDVYIHLLCN